MTSMDIAYGLGSGILSALAFLYAIWWADRHIGEHAGDSRAGTRQQLRPQGSASSRRA